MTFRNCVAVDLGASSGRVMLARYERECRSLRKCHSPWIKQGVRGRDSYR